MLTKVIVCGSVDHGKSTLLGRLNFESDSIRVDQKAAFLKSGSHLAHFTDGLRVEQEQGITLDVAYKQICFGPDCYQFIDAPGHAEFFHRFFSAATHADFGIFILDPNFGPTDLTWKQLQVLNGLNYNYLIIVLTKMDTLPNPSLKFEETKARWSETLCLKTGTTRWIWLSSTENINIDGLIQELKEGKTQSTRLPLSIQPSFYQTKLTGQAYFFGEPPTPKKQLLCLREGAIDIEIKTFCPSATKSGWQDMTLEAKEPLLVSPFLDNHTGFRGVLRSPEGALLGVFIFAELKMQST